MHTRSHSHTRSHTRTHTQTRARCAAHQVAKAPIIVGDPSYFPQDKVRCYGRVVRSICIIDHSINGTASAESTQIIIPGRQVSPSSFAINNVI
jgi:RAB protein geranylgeranyltransferase component A